MVVAGRKAKAQKRHRNQPTHDWAEVPQVPFEGAPNAPSGSWPARTKRWWKALSTMPHCVLWDVSDWEFAIDTGFLHAAFSRGELHRAAELRIREKVMGTTVDARRDLRIRYVEPVEEEREGVAAIETYRKRLAG